MGKNKICKVGNTILEWDESKACKTQEEIQAILDDIVTDAKRSIIAAEVEVMIETDEIKRNVVFED